jgi:hydrogenase-4 component B
MFSIWMILAGIALLGLSGLPACLFPARSPAGQRLAAALMLAGSLAGICGVAASLDAPTPPSWRVPWVLPWGQFAVALDPLSALFLGPVLVVPALGSLYGLGYWKQAEHPENGRRLGLFYGLLAGAMAMVVIARDGVLLLIAWEVMAIAAYFAATAEEDNPEVRRAGRVYLLAAHLGTLCLLALFALWHRAAGSFALEAAPGMPAELAGALFALALVGFGFKAGLMPLHLWLPGAHANAPSHVSAVMSGVMLKMGVYGIVRMSALLPAPAPWWGGVLLAAGAVTGVAGIAYAIGQHDLKRLLAYSSVENIGIIAMGLGLALLGRALGQPEWALLGLGGALLHTWNHSLFKPLLFFGAGAVIHEAHTRSMDRLGGLARLMPRTAAFFGVGAAAICALPPLNGFAGEWLLYVGFFRALVLGGGPEAPAVAAAAVALALIGALALACFVKLLGTVFLGSPRSEAAQGAREPQASMRFPMAVLAAGCAFLGLFPALAAPLLERAVGAWWEGPEPVALAAVAPLGWITALGLGLVALAGGLALLLRLLPRAALAARALTWDCGYAQPTPRMQYTGSSLGQTLVGLFAFLLWPKSHWPALGGPFPRGAHFKSLVPDAVLDRFAVPLFRLAGRYLPWVRVLQQGQTQLYVLYILLIVIVLLAWGAAGGQP